MVKRSQMYPPRSLCIYGIHALPVFLSARSTGTQNRVGQVWFLQVLGLFLREFDIESLCIFNEHSGR